MDILTPYLPQTPGLLPKWLLFVSVLALGNSFQTFLTLKFTRRVYSSRPDLVNALSSRTFGTWTFLSAVLRAYAAYDIGNRTVYDLALWSYVVAGSHFVSEWLVFGTASFGAGLTGPLVVASSSIVWMLTQREAYLSSTTAA